MIENKEQSRASRDIVLQKILELVRVEFPQDPREQQENLAANRLRRFEAGTWKVKYCTRCNGFEGVVEFGKHPWSKDKKQAWCRNCAIEVGTIGSLQAKQQRDMFMQYDGG